MQSTENSLHELLEEDMEIKKRVKEQITSIMVTLEHGCGRARCFGAFCSSNPSRTILLILFKLKMNS